MDSEIITNDFARNYPTLAGWVEDGFLEIGCGYTDSFIKVMDEGGMIWEGKKSYATIDEALQDAEKGLAAWLEENG